MQALGVTALAGGGAALGCSLFPSLPLRIVYDASFLEVSTPLVPWFPILGVIFCIALMLSLPVLTWIRFFVWLIIGLAIYFLYSVRHSRLRHGVDEGPTEEIVPPIIKP